MRRHPAARLHFAHGSGGSDRDSFQGAFWTVGVVLPEVGCSAEAAIATHWRRPKHEVSSAHGPAWQLPRSAGGVVVTKMTQFHHWLTPASSAGSEWGQKNDRKSRTSVAPADGGAARQRDRL